MNEIGVRRSGEASTDGVETVFSAVQVGFEVAEAAAGADDERRLRPHVLVKLAIVVALLAFIALAARRCRSSDAD